MNRYTFVVQVHPDGISTLENLTTQERVRVPDMSSVGLQIESWLRILDLSQEPARTSPVPSESALE